LEKTLDSESHPTLSQVEKEFDPYSGDKPRILLWPENQTRLRWSMSPTYAEQAGMPGLPTQGMDGLKSIACNRGLWKT